MALGSDPVTSLWLGSWDYSPGVSLSLPPGEDPFWLQGHATAGHIAGYQTEASVRAAAGDSVSTWMVAGEESKVCRALPSAPERLQPEEGATMPVPPHRFRDEANKLGDYVRGLWDQAHGEQGL